ncbi:MAG: hypothetical protein L3J18_11095 [Candidatus Brocadia sp.]|jgi:hypothetical protein|uniref:Uncharacterized protein n=1 Tax=Candidatus Brocadia fulgida TaxID=380242 RepID=A0A0M2UVV2_9BACT|nr:MAG: hypothetical protein BROFUL_01307 [Candidatus Brocadia fulgida]UJS19457.1 MAG: hypothetical protein L3J18_11095 [Candidatus Brocadia sp.]
MPEIIADHVSVVETSELKRFSRVGAKYYHPINSKHILEQHPGYENFERTDEQNWNLQREARVFKYFAGSIILD